MERMGLEVTVIDSPWGEGANEEKLAEILKVRLPSLALTSPSDCQNSCLTEAGRNSEDALASSGPDLPV